MLYDHLNIQVKNFDLAGDKTMPFYFKKTLTNQYLSSIFPFSNQFLFNLYNGHIACAGVACRNKHVMLQ